MTEPQPPDFVLHHYDGSPFSEKLRLILGFKGLAWATVKVPVIMPKPDVTALTGGYRKTPIAQVGADVYCDTALIARVIDRLAPTPPLYPAGAPLAPLLAQWADSTLFWTVIPYTMQPAGLSAIFAGVAPEVVKAFAADRAPFTAGLRRQTPADAAANLARHLAALGSSATTRALPTSRWRTASGTCAARRRWPASWRRTRTWRAGSTASPRSVTAASRR